MKEEDYYGVGGNCSNCRKIGDGRIRRVNYTGLVHKGAKTKGKHKLVGERMK
ncbi:MAG: hypothetical protein LBG43_05265 [Treponema sp.]|nr:hypothetical protein [Treponema sp.]